MAAVGAHGIRCQLPLHGKHRLAGRGAFWHRTGVQHGIHGAGPGLAQRAGGQLPAVANAAIVEDADFHIPRQRRVLQAIVADEDVHLGMGGAQRAGRVQALRGHKHRHAGAARQQQGLVAHVFGVGQRQHRAAIHRAAAIAARDDAGLPAMALQMAHDGLGDRGFARTTGNHIAHHDGGQSGVLGVGGIAAALVRGQGAVQQRQRPQQPGQRAPALPGAAQQGGALGAAAGLVVSRAGGRRGGGGRGRHACQISSIAAQVPFKASPSPCAGRALVL